MHDYILGVVFKYKIVLYLDCFLSEQNLGMFAYSLCNWYLLRGREGFMCDQVFHSYTFFGVYVDVININSYTYDLKLTRNTHVTHIFKA